MIDVPITLQSNVVGTFLEPMLLECFQNVIMQRYTITFCKPYKKLSMIQGLSLTFSLAGQSGQPKSDLAGPQLVWLARDTL